jgi:hypothetical protein
LLSPDSLYKGQIGQNLINPVTVINTQQRSQDWKAAILDVFSILTAGAFSYSFARYLAGATIWFPLTMLLLWGAASVLNGFLQKESRRRFSVIILETLAALAFFYSYAWEALAIAGILLVFCLMWGYLSVRRELRNTIEIRFFTASGKVMGKLVTGAVVFMIVMYAALSNNNGNFFVSQNGFDTFFNWGAQFVNNFYPTVPLTGSFGDFAQAVARMQLAGNPQFQSLTPAQQTEALTDSTSQIINTFSNASGTAANSGSAAAPITPSEPASQAFYGYLSSLAAKLQDRFNGAFVGVWGLILFLILRSIAIIFVWIGQFVSLVFYELLLSVGFLKIAEEPQTKEIIEY